MTQPDPTFAPLAAEAIDHLSTLLPLGWASVTIRRSPSADGLAIAKLSATSGRTSTPIPAALGIDPGLRAFLLSRVLTEIQDRLRERGIIWDGLTAKAERRGFRGADAIDLRLTTVHGDGIAKITIGMPDNHLIMTLPLLSAIESESPEWDVKEQTFRDKHETVGAWRFVYEESAIEIESASDELTRYPTEVLGTWSDDLRRWRWVWTDDNYANYHHERLKELRNQADLAVFRIPEFNCELGFASAVAWLACSRIGGKTVFSPPLGDTQKRVFFCLGFE